MLFNFLFANVTSLSFFIFLTIDLNFLALGVIAQILNPTAKLIVPIGIPTKEAQAQV